MNTIKIRCIEGKQDSDYIAELPTGEYTLIIEHPHHNPPFVYRRCKTIPTDKQAELVFAVSGGQTGVRSFSGRRTPNCDQSYYLGWNVMGYQFDMPSCYCQCCGYALDSITWATKVVALASLEPQYLEELRFKCKKSNIPLSITDTVSA